MEEFYDFLRVWADSAPEVDSPSWPACRRQGSGLRFPGFAGSDAPRAMLPRLPAVCSMLQLLVCCPWKSVHYLYEP